MTTGLNVYEDVLGDTKKKITLPALKDIKTLKSPLKGRVALKTLKNANLRSPQRVKIKTEKKSKQSLGRPALAVLDPNKPKTTPKKKNLKRPRDSSSTILSPVKRRRTRQGFTTPKKIVKTPKKPQFRRFNGEGIEILPLDTSGEVTMHPLYLGDISVAKDLVWLKTRRIKTVVNATKVIKNFYSDPDFGITYNRVPVADSEEAPIAKYFEDITDFIHAQRAIAPVLVHCRAGQSRSVSVLHAYLMKYVTKHLKKTTEIFTSKNIKTKINNGFKKQLMKTEKLWFSQNTIDFFDLGTRVRRTPSKYMNEYNVYTPKRPRTATKPKRRTSTALRPSTTSKITKKRRISTKKKPTTPSRVVKVKKEPVSQADDKENLPNLSWHQNLSWQSRRSSVVGTPVTASVATKKLLPVIQPLKLNLDDDAIGSLDSNWHF